MAHKLWATFSKSSRTLFALAGFFAVSQTAPGLAAEDTVKVGFLLKTMQEARYQTDKTLFTARVESEGAEVVFDSSGNDPLLQLQQVEKMLEDGIDVLVLQPVNTSTAGALVELAHQAGVKVVGYDSMLQGGPLDVMVMQDSWRVGQLQGEALVNWLTAKKGEATGRVALIRGQPGDSNAAALSSGVLETLKANPGIELVADRSHVDWSPDLARESAETLLVEYDNGIDAFVANNSGMAFGVIAALRDEGLDSADQVFVAGSDADLRNIRLVATGVQSLEIWKQIKPLAFGAADAAMAIANAPDTDVAALIGEHKLVDNGFAEIPTIITPVFAVSKSTIDDTVISGGFYTSEQVYGQ